MGRAGMSMKQPLQLDNMQWYAVQLPMCVTLQKEGICSMPLPAQHAFWVRNFFVDIHLFVVKDYVHSFVLCCAAYCALVRWTCWNTIFLITVIQAHNVKPYWHYGMLVAALNSG